MLNLLSNGRDDEHLHYVIHRTDVLRRFALFPRKLERHLAPVDDRTFRAGLVGANRAGLQLSDARR